MKVLQINSVCGIGSTGRIATDIHSMLIEQGHQSYIAYGKRTPKGCSSAIKIGTRFDNYTHALKTRLFDIHGFGSKRSTLEFIKKVIDLNPDIIHLHNIHGYYINIEILFDYLKSSKKPVIWTLHDCWSFTGHCAHFDYIRCDRWKSSCYSCPQKNQYPKSILLDKSKENYILKKNIFSSLDKLKIVTPSEWLKKQLSESFLSEIPVEVIYNGVDLNVFKPVTSNFRKANNLQDKYIILGVASPWHRRKGYEHFIELAKKIKQDQIIVMVGLSKQQIKSLPDNILGIERTNNPFELAEIYSAADVFVNLTLEETLGLTNIEALSTGTPVVTFDSGGSPETIDKSCGVVVERDNVNELINGISEIMDYDKEYYTEKCINRARQLFDKYQNYNKYLGLYQKMLKNFKES